MREVKLYILLIIFTFNLFLTIFIFSYLFYRPCEGIYWNRMISFFEFVNLTPGQCFLYSTPREWEGIWVLNDRENDFYPKKEDMNLNVNKKMSIYTTDQSKNLIRSFYYGDIHDKDKSINLFVRFRGQLYYENGQNGGRSFIYTSRFSEMRKLEPVYPLQPR